MKSDILKRLDRLDAALDKQIPPLEIEYTDGERVKAEWTDVMFSALGGEYDRRPVKAIYYSRKLIGVIDLIRVFITNDTNSDGAPLLVEVKE